MGKKKLRGTYSSKGVHSNVSASTLRLVRTSTDNFTKSLNKISAWRAGKNPWITIKNPVASETNRRFIKVRANTIYGNPKFISSGLFKGSEGE